MIKIRSFIEENWTATWKIIEPVFRAGETYAFSTDITEDEAYNEWVTKPSATYVALDEKNEIIGTYFIKPNQPALGAHVCNCGYVVSENSRNKGFGGNTNAAKGSVDRPYVDWNAKGYRLPTECEWNHAASYKNGTDWTPYDHASGAYTHWSDAADVNPINDLAKFSCKEVE